MPHNHKLAASHLQHKDEMSMSVCEGYNVGVWADALEEQAAEDEASPAQQVMATSPTNTRT